MLIYVNFRLNMSLKLMGDMANVVGVGWEFAGRVKYSQEYNFLYLSVPVQNLFGFLFPFSKFFAKIFDSEHLGRFLKKHPLFVRAF